MKKLLATSLLALGLMAGASQAATILSLTTGTAAQLDGSYNPNNAATGAGSGDNVLVADSFGEGLLLDGAATLVFTFLGKEAGFNNFFKLVVGDQLLFTNGSAVGSSTLPLSISPDAGGFLPFKFVSGSAVPLDVFNGNVSGAGALATIAFKMIGTATANTASFLALFNDGGGPDADYDDMVIRIDAIRDNQQVVPLPAGLLLLLSGLAGLGFIGRSRAKKA